MTTTPLVPFKDVQTSGAACILALLNIRGVGPSRVRVLMANAKHLNVALDAQFLVSTNGGGVLTTQQMDGLSSAIERAERTIEELDNRQVRAITLSDQSYPLKLLSRLGRLAPPLLFTIGDLKVAEASTVGFCGSRRASDKGLGVTRDIAEQLSQRRVALVSGYAAGVDTEVHTAALKHHTATIVVLAEGITHFRVKRELQRDWNDDDVLVLSEFLPGLPWSARQAMQRNATICALSDAMVLIEAGETGGSIAAGRTALSMGVPLFAPVYEGMPESAEGNRVILREGALPLLKDRKSDRANVAPILEVLETSRRQGAKLSRAGDQLAFLERD